MKKILLITGSLYLFGCTTISEVIPIGPDLYIISVTSHGYEKSIDSLALTLYPFPGHIFPIEFNSNSGQ